MSVGKWLTYTVLGLYVSVRVLWASKWYVFNLFPLAFKAMISELMGTRKQPPSQVQEPAIIEKVVYP